MGRGKAQPLGRAHNYGSGACSYSGLYLDKSSQSPPTTTEYRLKFRFLRPSFTRTYVGIVSPSFVPSCAFFVAFRGNVVKRSVPIVYDMGIVRFILGKKVRRWQVGSIR